MTDASYTLVTVQTGKEYHYNAGGMGLKKYVAGDTLTIPTADAVKAKAAGLVTY